MAAAVAAWCYSVRWRNGGSVRGAAHIRPTAGRRNTRQPRNVVWSLAQRPDGIGRSVQARRHQHLDACRTITPTSSKTHLVAQSAAQSSERRAISRSMRWQVGGRWAPLGVSTTFSRDRSLFGCVVLWSMIGGVGRLVRTAGSCGVGRLGCRSIHSSHVRTRASSPAP